MVVNFRGMRGQAVCCQSWCNKPTALLWVGFDERHGTVKQLPSASAATSPFLSSSLPCDLDQNSLIASAPSVAKSNRTPQSLQIKLSLSTLLPAFLERPDISGDSYRHEADKRIKKKGRGAMKVGHGDPDTRRSRRFSVRASLFYPSARKVQAVAPDSKPHNCSDGDHSSRWFGHQKDPKHRLGWKLDDRRQ